MNLLPLLFASLGAPPTEPPLVPGAHVCGDHWSGYNERCVLTQEGEGWRLKSEGPTSTIDGKIEVLGSDRFRLVGSVLYGRGPLSIDDLADCPEPGPFVFKRVGKRKYFRYVRTCKDMTTFYFDVFVDPVDVKTPPTAAPLKELAAGFAFTWPRPQASTCEPADGPAKRAPEARCQRYAVDLNGKPYHFCKLSEAHDGEGLVVYAKRSACNASAQRLFAAPQGE